MAAVAPSRLAALTRLRCEIFQTAYNPTSVRTGAKYLRARLRGPSMIQYYPDELTVARFNHMGGNFKIQDWDEYQRLTDVEEKKRRGKGAPKKAKSPGACCHTFCARATLMPRNSCSGESEAVSQAVTLIGHIALAFRYVYFVIMLACCLSSLGRSTASEPQEHQ